MTGPLSRLGRVLVLVLVPVAAGAQVPWAEGTVLGVPTTSPSTVALYISALGLDPQGDRPKRLLEQLQWHTIDLTDTTYPQSLNIPQTAKAVFLSGTLITSGQTGVFCAIIGTFRAPGDTLSEWNYQIAAVASVASGAFRQNVALWVPVIDRKFEFWWHYQDATCPMIINLSLQAYVR